MPIESKDVVIYISGRITGLTKDQYTSDFKKAQEYLEDKFPYAQIINPVEVMSSIAYLPYTELMALCFVLLRNATSIYMLDGYTYSKGAMAELAVAKSFNINVMFEDNSTF